MTRAQVIAAYRKAAELARGEGVTVRFRTGWTTRGRVGLNPRCIVEHDTSDGARLSPSRMLAILTDGHGALAGNAICNDAILTDGVVWVIASGIAWHAGNSSWDGIATLNSNGLGTEYQRYIRDPLNGRQLEVGRIWTRARCAAFGIPARRVCEHFECAVPAGRKVDRSARPGVRMSGSTWRSQVGSAAAPPSGGSDVPLRDWAAASWAKLRRKANLDEGTHGRSVDRQELAVILDRLGLLDVLDEPAHGKVLGDFARLLRAEGSSGYIARELVGHLRDHPSGGGGSGVSFTAEQARQVARDEIGRARLTPGS